MRLSIAVFPILPQCRETVRLWEVEGDQDVGKAEAGGVVCPAGTAMALVMML